MNAPGEGNALRAVVEVTPLRVDETGRWAEDVGGWKVSPGLPWMPKGHRLVIDQAFEVVFPAGLGSDGRYTLGDKTFIGYGTTIAGQLATGDGCDLGPKARLGADCRLGANVKIALARVGDRARLLNDVVIRAGSTVGNDVLMGKGVVIGDHCTIGDGCQIGMNVRIGPDAKLGDRCLVEPDAYIKGATVIPAGSIVRTDGTISSPTVPVSEDGVIDMDTPPPRL